MVRVSASRAGAGLRSAKYLTIDGAPPPTQWDPLSGFYPAASGRAISIHCNFPHHRDAAIRVLGAAADRNAMQAASAVRDGAALEDAIHEAGGCAGYVRTGEEWRRHPQCAAVATQKLLSIERIGDAPPRPLPFADRPLSGVRVLDLTRVLAGPTCARSLAEHGAMVLKVNGPHLPDSGATELDTGVGKRAAFIDLRDPTGVATLRTLAARTDVFSQGYRPGTLAARGFSPTELAARNPGIVCLSLSAWGSSGPWSARRGFDTIVQSVSGMAAESGSIAKPRYLPVSAIDYISGYLMSLGAMAALTRRATEGGSWLVTVSLARAGQWIADQGRVTEAEWRATDAEFAAADIAAWSTESNSPSGVIGHLSPVVQMPATPARWDEPPAAPGTHPPVWW